MFLKINDKGLILSIDGKEFRTPLNMDISKYNINKIIMALHLSSIKDFSITGSNKTEPIRKADDHNRVEIKKNKNNIPELNNKVDFLMNRIEDKFQKFEKNLMKKIENTNPVSKEQINNLKKIELFMQQFYEHGETPKKIFKKESDETESFFIPAINSDMKLQGSSTKTLSNKEDVGDAVDALASLLKK